MQCIFGKTRGIWTKNCRLKLLSEVYLVYLQGVPLMIDVSIIWIPGLSHRMEALVYRRPKVLPVPPPALEWTETSDVGGGLSEVLKTWTLMDNGSWNRFPFDHHLCEYFFWSKLKWSKVWNVSCLDQKAFKRFIYLCFGIACLHSNWTPWILLHHVRG